MKGKSENWRQRERDTFSIYQESHKIRFRGLPSLALLSSFLTFLKNVLTPSSHWSEVWGISVWTSTSR